MRKYNTFSNARKREHPVRSYLDQLKESVDLHHVEESNDIGEKLKVTLLEYMSRPSSDSKVLQLLGAFADKLSIALNEGKMGEPLADTKLRDVRAALVGASMVIDPAGDTFSPIGSPEDIGLARRFLEMTEGRVGTVNHTTGDADIRMRTDPKGSGRITKHYKPPNAGS